MTADDPSISPDMDMIEVDKSYEPTEAAALVPTENKEEPATYNMDLSDTLPDDASQVEAQASAMEAALDSQLDLDLSAEKSTSPPSTEDAHISEGAGDPDGESRGLPENTTADHPEPINIFMIPPAHFEADQAATINTLTRTSSNNTADQPASFDTSTESFTDPTADQPNPASNQTESTTHDGLPQTELADASLGSISQTSASTNNLLNEIGPQKLLCTQLLVRRSAEKKASENQDPRKLADAIRKFQADLRAQQPAFGNQTEDSGVASSSRNTPGHTVLPTAPANTGLSIDTDSDAWMADIGNSIEEEDIEKLKHELKSRESKYNSRKRKDRTTMTEDIDIIKVQREYRARIATLEKGKIAMTEKPMSDPPVADDDEDEDSLFLPERPTQKRASGKIAQDTGDYEPAEPPAKRAKNSRKKDDLRAAELREARPKGTNKPQRQKQSRQPGEDASKKNKRNTGKPKEGKDGKSKAKKKKKNTVMANYGSLWTSDPIRDAQANAGQEAIPTFTASSRQEALKQLVSSIPTAERDRSDAMGSDKKAVMDAARKFATSRSIKADQQGGWLLKGMQSSLWHHQLLGSGWMRERETAGVRPHGGLVADEMGFGKTIQMIANIIDDRPTARQEPNRTTLIVVTPGLMDQWMDEFRKHCAPDNLPKILKYSSGNRLDSSDIVSDLRSYDCIVTSYQEIRKSYPKTEAPASLTTEKALNAWWQKYYRENSGPFHKIRFRRVVLDEAQQIKNPDSRTSQAVRALVSHYRWAITGTPIQNYLEEMFAYMDFLKCPNTGSFELFKANYCNGRQDKKDHINPDRMAFMLQGIMLRRTHKETLFSRPIVTLPEVKHRTDAVTFTPVETAIYKFVKTQFIHKINRLSSEGKLTSHWRNVLTMMHHLRMLTGHILLVQQVLKDSLTAGDVESLWRLTGPETKERTPSSQLNTNSIVTLRRLINAKKIAKDAAGGKEPEEDGIREALRKINEEDAHLDTGHKFALTFKFRKFLRALSESNAWTELQERSLCSRCKNPPDEPYVTKCFHIYCKECLETMSNEAALNELDSTHCMECGAEYQETSPCDGLQELGWDERLIDRPQPAQKQKGRPRKNKKNQPQRSTSSTPDLDDSEGKKDVDWITYHGDLLPSAKTMAAKAQLLTWFENSPDEKVVIFTQWIDMIRIFERICSIEQWGCVAYHGKMGFDTRNKNIKKFTDDANCKIMLCSLKAGGVGLNLTMASKVLILDLYWNNSVEKQAFCRCFRIGQRKEVDIVRYVVKDTIDEDLVMMQQRKIDEIDSVMGDDVRQKKAGIDQLLGLFGPVREGDEDENPFIFVEDERQESDADAEPEVPIRPRN